MTGIVDAINKAAGLAVVASTAVLTPVGVSHGEIVEMGWDLFRTIDPTNFMGVPFEGVPLHTFDFGFEPIDVDVTDTIVQRLVVAQDMVPVPIEMLALQLVSAVPFDAGGGFDFHYITLQPDTASTGEMTISFNESGTAGTFSSFIDVAFDLRLGALDGPIVFSDILQLSASDATWDRVPDANVFLIEGVNWMLNGEDKTADFFPDPFTEVHPKGAEHSVATVPTPGVLALLAVGGVVCVQRRGCRRRCDSPGRLVRRHAD